MPSLRRHLAPRRRQPGPPSENYLAKSSRQQFQEAFRLEYERTEKVLRAYPHDQTSFKPHERSRTALDIAMPLVLGIERPMVTALTMGFDWSKPPALMPPEPETMSKLADRLVAAYRLAIAALEAADDALLDSTIQFFVAPKTPGDVPLMDFPYP